MAQESSRKVGITGSGVLARLANIGTAGQAAIPGAYAWALTVAPAAWARGAPWVAKLAAAGGLLALALAVRIERRSSNASQIVSVWGLVLTSVVVWMLVPSAVSALHLDATRGVAGMIGWALFALASAAPVLKQLPSPAVRGTPGALRPRNAVLRGDIGFILGGVLLALGLQSFGWHVATAERALLVRLLAVVTGLAVIETATAIGLSRHARGVPSPVRRRVRRATPWVGLAVLLLVGGAIFALSR